jgi:HlyD family secretion protein
MPTITEAPNRVPLTTPAATPVAAEPAPHRVAAGPERKKPVRHVRSRAIVIGILVLIVAGIAFALRPTPVDVDVTVATVAPMRVTVDADAVTRVRQPFAITAPVGGMVQRLAVRPGDVVRAGDPLASITTPPLFTTEKRAVASRVDAALASRLQFDARLSQAELALAQAQRDEARARQLVAAGALAERDLELATLTVVSRRADLGTVRAQQRVAVAELAQARAALDAAAGQDGATTVVRAPSAGHVLSVPQRSARVVSAGTALLELGDPNALEVAADVLSRDAASVQAGQKAILRGWGGTPIDGVVRVVEPSARTRVSALGVEEQRLTVVIDAARMPRTLGDGYRLDASIVVWEGRPLTIPASALLREGDAWWLFTLRDDRAARRRVDIGHVGNGVAEVRGGLRAGDRVVLFPPDVLRDGARVRAAR